jgi:hypothetical protein
MTWSLYVYDELRNDLLLRKMEYAIYSMPQGVVGVSPILCKVDQSETIRINMN